MHMGMEGASLTSLHLLQLTANTVLLHRDSNSSGFGVGAGASLSWLAANSKPSAHGSTSLSSVHKVSTTELQTPPLLSTTTVPKHSSSLAAKAPSGNVNTSKGKEHAEVVLSTTATMAKPTRNMTNRSNGSNNSTNSTASANGSKNASNSTVVMNGSKNASNSTPVLNGSKNASNSTPVNSSNNATNSIAVANASRHAANSTMGISGSKSAMNSTELNDSHNATNDAAIKSSAQSIIKAVNGTNNTTRSSVGMNVSNGTNNSVGVDDVTYAIKNSSSSNSAGTSKRSRAYVMLKPKAKRSGGTARAPQSALSTSKRRAVSISKARGAGQGKAIKTQAVQAKLENSTSSSGPLSKEVVIAIRDAVQRAAYSEEEMLMERLGSKLEDMVTLEVELGQQPPLKSKTILAVVEVLGLGFFGVDRCIMGQTCLGVVKGVTLGGFMLWMLLDYAVIIINCLASWSSISAVGYHAQFNPETIHPAFLICLIVTILKCTCLGCGGLCSPKRRQNERW